MSVHVARLAVWRMQMANAARAEGPAQDGRPQPRGWCAKCSPGRSVPIVMRLSGKVVCDVCGSDSVTWLKADEKRLHELREEDTR